MTGKQSLLTDLYENDPITVPKYPTEFDAASARQWSVALVRRSKAAKNNQRCVISF